MRITRRRFLAASGASAAAFALGGGRAFSGAPAPSPTFLVVVNLIGGNDGLNTVPPLGLQPYHERRPSVAIADGLPLDGVNGLHPALPGLLRRWGEGRLHVVRRVGYPEANLSHFASQDIYATGVRHAAQGDGRGWLGRFADLHAADALGVIGVGTGRRLDFAARDRPALVLSTVAGFHLEHDPDFIPDHVLRVKHARRILAREAEPADPSLLAAAREAHALVDHVQEATRGWTDPGLYPATPLAQRLKTISRLEWGGFGTRAYFTALGGFDTHANQRVRHQALLAELDGALDAFATDMEGRGRWRDCVVVIASEFGRRTAENGSAGTDHGHANAFLVTGGAVRGGITGSLTEADLLADQPAMAYDFRELYAHLLARHLDVDPAPIFPEPFARTDDLAVV